MKKLLKIKRRKESKYLSIQTRLLVNKEYNFLLGRMYLTSDDVFQNMFVYQPTFSALHLKKIESLIMLLVRNQKRYIVLIFSHNILFFCIA